MAAAFGGYMATFFKSKILFLVATVILIFMLANPIFLPQGIRERMASTFGGNKVVSTDVADITDVSAGDRILIWRGAIEMIKAQPIFGFGYGTFRYIIGSFAPNVAGFDPHNTYLMLAAEMGIPALILFLLILIILIKNGRWLLRHSKDKYFRAFALGMLGGLFGLLVVNIFGSRLNSEEVSSYFWLLSGLLMRAVAMRRQKQIA
jgi:O-antigen ligase